MHFASSNIPASTAYKLLTSTIVPRPIAFVTSINSDGVINAAPFSFFNAMGSEPPVIALGFEPKSDGNVKDTPYNIIEMKEFVVNLVDEKLAGQMNISSGSFPANQSEIEIAGLDIVSSIEVKVPRLKASPVSMECRLFEHIPLGGGGSIIIGEILHFHIRDEIIQQTNPLRVDVNKLGAIARLAGPDYVRITDQFQIKRPQ
jgi:flavin reductase (DIM6/NTAB) family NADH-FMN oxidoreductase RutF